MVENTMKYLFSLIFLVTSFCSAAPSVINLDNAVLLTKDCEGCHGTDGVSQGSVIPNLAGAHRKFLFDTMKKYQSGKYLSTVMQSIAKAYTDQELKLIAAYYAKKIPVAAIQPFNAALVAQGKKYHQKYCKKCHGSDKEVNDDEASQLAGQWTDFLKMSLLDIKKGNHPVPRKMDKRLKRLLARHGNQAMKSLLAYYASQQGQKDAK